MTGGARRWRGTVRAARRRRGASVGGGSRPPFLLQVLYQSESLQYLIRPRPSLALLEKDMTDSSRHAPLVEHIPASFARLTATEKRAARVLLDNYPMAGLATAASFATAAGVSAPTVLRLVDKLGFNGYAEFQARLLEELEARLASPLERAGGGPGARENEVHFLHRYAEQACANVMRSVEHLPAAEIEAVSQLIMNEKRRVYLVGGRFSAAPARLVHAHLHAGQNGRA